MRYKRRIPSRPTDLPKIPTHTELFTMFTSMKQIADLRAGSFGKEEEYIFYKLQESEIWVESIGSSCVD